MTATDLIIAAIQRLTGDNAIPPPDEVQTGLLRLNDLIDSWKIEGLTINSFSRMLWPLTGAATYSVGAGADVNIDRPSNATGLSFAVVDTSVTPPLEIGRRNYSEAAYRSIVDKTQTTTSYPWGFYYNPTVPFGALVPYPISTASGLQGVMYAPNPRGELALTDVLVLPQGYRRFYRDTLAVELGPDYSTSPSQVLIQSAIDAKASVKRSNLRLDELVSEAAALDGSSGDDSISAFYAGP